MNVFEKLREKVKLSLSDWIQIVDPRSQWSLDNVRIIKDVGVDPEQVKPHCVKCVVVNQCWFKNEKGKKPEPFGYEKYSNVVLSKMKGIMGLYHPRCHCKEIPIAEPTEQTLKVVCGDDKVDDFFKRKNGLAFSWGYKASDKHKFKEYFISQVTEEYLKSNYKIHKYNEFGFQISIFIMIPGINEKIGRFYKRETGFMVFPNGKIQNDTIVGRKWK